jgi:hypothetical protein
MRLDESGVQDEVECPYCKYPEAHSLYESRAEFRYKKVDYSYYTYCDLCGWEHYGDADDEAGEIDIPPKPAILAEAKKIVKKIYDKIDTAREDLLELFFEFGYDKFNDYKLIYKTYHYFMIGLMKLVFSNR